MTPPPKEFIFEQTDSMDRAALDLYLYLASVKTHLADNRPMDDADEAAWGLIDMIQNAEEL